jgi:sugar-specific transcriptional regulator TrmB
MNRDVEALMAAGLSEKEAVVYLDLLAHGESQTGAVCRRTRIPSSHIYSILGSLLEKGLANYKIVNNIKVFRASEPDALSQLFEEREAKIREEKGKLLESVSKLKLVRPEERMGDFKYFRGIRGIKSLYTEIINSWKKGDEYFIASAPLESFSKLEGFFLDVVHRKRVKDKVRLRMLVNKAGKEWGKARESMPLTEVRYLDVDTNTEYGVLNDYFFLISYGEGPYGLLIRDRNFADTYKKFFELMWKQAKG